MTGCAGAGFCREWWSEGAKGKVKSKKAKVKKIKSQKSEVSSDKEYLAQRRKGRQVWERDIHPRGTEGAEHGDLRFINRRFTPIYADERTAKGMAHSAKR